MNSNGIASTPEPYDDVTVRWADARDSEAIRRLAERDSAVTPAGPMLVAEVGGRVMAARPMDGERAIADPFHPTRDLVDLLELRAAQISARGQVKGRGVTALWLSRHLLGESRNGSRPAARPGLAGR